MRERKATFFQESYRKPVLAEFAGNRPPTSPRSVRQFQAATQSDLRRPRVAAALNASRSYSRKHSLIVVAPNLPELVGAEAKVAVENHLHNRATRQNSLRPFVMQDGGESHTGSDPGSDADAAQRVTRPRSGDGANPCADAAAGGDRASVA